MHGTQTLAAAPPLTLTDQVLDLSQQTALAAGADARQMVSACLLDWTACTVLGAREPLVETLLADAQDYGRPGNVPLVGRSERLDIREAVLVNGAAGHALDYDDGLEPMIAHPSVSVAPALLALAAELGRSGSDLVTAYVLALEFGSRIGRALSYTHYNRGFHGTATVGALAVAAGCAWLLDLPREERAIAIGLAATRTGGLKASFGTDAKPLHPGWAALVGLTAAQWAQRGFSGALDMVGSPVGLRSFTDGYDVNRALADGSPAILRVTFKRYAACGMTHPAIEAILKLRRQQPIDPDQIRRVIVHIVDTAGPTCNLQQVDTGLHAKFSVRMIAAMALSGVDLAVPDNFSDAAVSDPKLHALFDRVEVDLTPDLSLRLSAVTVELMDGTVFKSEADMEGSDPASEMRAVRPKFDALVRPVLGDVRAARLGDSIEAIERAVSVADLLEGMRVEG